MNIASTPTAPMRGGCADARRSWSLKKIKKEKKRNEKPHIMSLIFKPYKTIAYEKFVFNFRLLFYAILWI